MGRNKMKNSLLIVFSMLLFLVSLGFTQEEKPSITAVDPFAQRISLDLRNIDIIEALKFLSSKTGMNIVTSKLVTGRVNLTVENCLVKDIFDIILRSNGLAYDKKGDIYYIMTEQEYKNIYGKNFSDMREVKVFRLKYAIPQQAFSLLDTLKSEVGRILVDPESGNVLIMDIPENIKIMEKALEDFEKKDIIEVFALRYAKAKEIEDILKTKLDEKKVGSIKADERNNQVIVQALPQRMEEIRRLISLLDRQTKEVLIDAKIIKVGLSDQVETGIEWEGLFDVARKYGLTYLGSYPFSYIGKSTDPWISRYTWYYGGNFTLGNETYSYSGLRQIGSYPFSGTTSNYIGTPTSSPASTKKAIGEAMHIGII
ncbi:MAG: hypothetical protein N2Z79_01055, partial [Candidatus Omnitrophica bacterium]|nr:hypothetical protein [Candidatus Omnitrophota bacterium]